MVDVGFDYVSDLLGIKECFRWALEKMFTRR